MVIILTNTDIALLKSLLDDGRKSFRQISKEIDVSTPTVKARFNRLVDMGIITSVSPILDLNKLHISKKKNGNNFEIDSLIKYQEYLKQQLVQKRKDGISLNIKCSHCKTPIVNRIFTLKFGDHERFFCCDACRNAYKEKYGARINAISKRYRQNYD